MNAPRSTLNINDFAEKIAEQSKFHNYPQGRELLFHIPLLLDLNYVFSEITQKHAIRCLYIENKERTSTNPMENINQLNEYLYHFTEDVYKTPEDLSYLKIVSWIREQYGIYISFIFECQQFFTFFSQFYYFFFPEIFPFFLCYKINITKFFLGFFGNNRKLIE